MPIETITIDVYTSVYSASLGHVLVTGTQDVEVPKAEAERWLGTYALLSSERVVEDKDDDTSRPVKAPRGPRKKGNDKHEGAGDRKVGKRDVSVG